MLLEGARIIHLTRQQGMKGKIDNSGLTSGILPLIQLCHLIKKPPFLMTTTIWFHNPVELGSPLVNLTFISSAEVILLKTSVLLMVGESTHT